MNKELLGVVCWAMLISAHATDAPTLYDSQGNDRGNLSANPYSTNKIYVVPSR